MVSVSNGSMLAFNSMGIKCLTLLLSKFPESATYTTATLTWPSLRASNSFMIANLYSALLVKSFWSSTTWPTAISGFSPFLLKFVGCVSCGLTKYSFLQAAVNWFSKCFWCCHRELQSVWKASYFQLLKLENWLWWSFFTFSIIVFETLNNFSLEGHPTVEIHLFRVFARIPLVTFVEHFNSCVGHEYKPWHLIFCMWEISSLTSCRVTRLKANNKSADSVLLRKSA